MSGARRRRPRVDGPSLYMDGGMDRLVNEPEERKTRAARTSWSA